MAHLVNQQVAHELLALQLLTLLLEKPTDDSVECVAASATRTRKHPSLYSRDTSCAHVGVLAARSLWPGRCRSEDDCRLA